MKNDDVFAFGSNSCGCLGVGDIKSTLVPQKISDLCGKGVVSKFTYFSLSYSLSASLILVLQLVEMNPWTSLIHTDY